ncbi:MAG: extradiol dioxygenase [Candidatus Eremiobacteraeota bacterium]|nr:extradiol dioxygenase [Candidatus Eremiobacteraeota bacterium]
MITGIHALIYSKHAQRIQAFLGEVLELRSVDAREGWPIFAAPPTEIAVHPTEGEPGHELYLMCDDVRATVERLVERGITSTPVEDRGWGLVTQLEFPDGERIGLYEPRHPSPLKATE